ncbi:EPIDERMAL PATTERNING FACTOR-like protein 6 [Sarracenia purpurea var. burkii]
MAQDVEMILSQIKEEMVISDGEREVPPSMTRTRRLLSVPGSWPPRCASKCGKCISCKPVHVTVPPGKLVSPGTPVTTEYYPEAWRCKCGNKLYMP